MYIHIPFCVKRCNYCDFTTYSGIERWIPEYFEALKREIQIAGVSSRDNVPVHTLFFGGGTPSVVPTDYYKGLFDVIYSNFRVDHDAEISFEANPGTVNENLLSEYKKIGFNRISLGAQSFHDGELKLLGRIHNSQGIYQAVESIRDSGFDNMNLDLIYGLPGQTLSKWKQSLTRAIALEPEHLSLYSLTIEEGTPFAWDVAQGKLDPLPDDEAAEMYELAMDMLDEAGYKHYEISNWAKRSNERDYRCRHNLQYWRNLEYYGFGAGAHGYIKGLRVANIGTIPEYIQQISISSSGNRLDEESTSIAEDEAMHDEMMLGMRLIDEGVSASAFFKRYGRDMRDVFSKEITKLIESNLIRWTDGVGSSLVLSRRGILLGNQVFMEFVKDQ